MNRYNGFNDRKCEPQFDDNIHISKAIDPFMTLSFMSLPVIPTLRLTTRGVIDVITQKYI